MDTKRKNVHVLQCTRCDNTFMQVGHTVIGMAYPRRVHRKYNEVTGNMEDMTGVCPAHRKKIGEE